MVEMDPLYGSSDYEAQRHWKEFRRWKDLASARSGEQQIRALLIARAHFNKAVEVIPLDPEEVSEALIEMIDTAELSTLSS